MLSISCFTLLFSSAILECRSRVLHCCSQVPFLSVVLVCAIQHFIASRHHFVCHSSLHITIFVYHLSLCITIHSTWPLSLPFITWFRFKSLPSRLQEVCTPLHLTLKCSLKHMLGMLIVCSNAFSIWFECLDDVHLFVTFWYWLLYICWVCWYWVWGCSILDKLYLICALSDVYENLLLYVVMYRSWINRSRISNVYENGVGINQIYYCLCVNCLNGNILDIWYS